MKSMLTLALLSLVLPVFAQEAPKAEVKAADTNEVYYDMITGKKWTPDSKFTIAQLKARDERVLKKTGGFLYIEEKGPQVMLLDAREKAPATIDGVGELYTLGTKLPVQIAKQPRGEKCPLEVGREIIAKGDTLLVVVVADKCDKLPALTVYPEERVGVVNADKLKGDTNGDPSAPEVRVAKEVWRAMGFIGGVGFSAQDNDVMQPVYSVAEVDGMRNPYIQPMNMQKMTYMWKRFGVDRKHRVPYRKAVQDGWAPAPTNDYQKAVWQEEQTNKVGKAAAPAAAK